MKGDATMKQKTTIEQAASTVCYEMIEAKARERIQSWLQGLLEEEVTEFLGRGKSQRRSQEAVVGYRNGYGKPRHVALSSGTVSVRRPRLRNLGDRFESRVLPLFKRRSQELGAMLPRLYLHGLSSGDFEVALRGLLGEGAPLSAASLQRLKGVWQAEYEQWKQGDLSQLELVYWWADGLYVKAGIADRKAALLVIVGALADGHLGIWAALGEIHPGGDEQRCWNHKIINVLDALGKKDQATASEYLRAMMYAPSRSACQKKRDEFVLRFKKTDAKACATLMRDWERLITFFDYPQEHWTHLRTTNIVESPFDQVRLRTDAARRFRKTENAEAMIWKLLCVAEQSWRALNAPHLMKAVYEGKRFKDGVAMPTRMHPTREAA